MTPCETKHTDPLDPLSPDLGPWRMHASGWVVAMGGVPLEQPKQWHQVTHCDTDLVGVSFVTPSVAALHLSAAWKSAIRATELRAKVRWNESPAVFAQQGLGAKAARQVEHASIETLFDYFEESMAAALFAFSSLEAFCNVTLVERLSGPVMVKKEKGHKLMSAEEIEERESTTLKLKRLVPDALGVASPAGKAIWMQYHGLKDLRDSITHFKRRELGRPDLQPTALHKLLNQKPSEAPAAALAVLQYFHATHPQRWLVSPMWSQYAARCHALEAGGQAGGQSANPRET